MNSRLTGILMLVSMVIMTSGCVSQGLQTESLISAAEFDEMIRVEVHEIEPMPIDEVVAATTSNSVR